MRGITELVHLEARKPAFCPPFQTVTTVGYTQAEDTESLRCVWVRLLSGTEEFSEEIF